jgi:hypothetical protein
MVTNALASSFVTLETIYFQWNGSHSTQRLNMSQLLKNEVTNNS